MLRSVKIQLRILVIHGILALCLGLSFFYLLSTMTNSLFDIFSIVIAILLTAAALILAAVADWSAAWGEGTKHLRRLVFYLFAGLAFALTGIFLGFYSRSTLQLICVLAAIHALVFGLLGIVLARRTRPHQAERFVLSLLGIVSILFSGTVAGLVPTLDDRSATTILGAYMCFVALKLFYMAWTTRKMAKADEVSNVEIGSRQGALAGH